MEIFPSIHPSPWPLYFPFLYSYSFPSNYVHWTQTPDSHLFSADLPGVRKEDIRVEVEDSRYLVIRTECSSSDNGDSGDENERRRFMRKFRLPQMVDVDGISAGYADGVLTVTVPRSFAGGRFTRLDVNPAELHARANDSAARAA